MHIANSHRRNQTLLIMHLHILYVLAGKGREWITTSIVGGGEGASMTRGLGICINVPLLVTVSKMLMGRIVSVTEMVIRRCLFIDIKSTAQT
jgi:hypothetical protein